ncbi:MAG: glycoside hydrolase family 43 protein [Oscillospiraceae bacterium]|jgi:beta-xylosidase|nr:glycoside hydrolase family 43 protein [Oscillospiraceae bacterium]
MSGFRKPLVRHIFTADPSAHVFAGKIYIYPSHDVDLDVPDDDDGDQYQMTDYHVLSMERPGAECVDCGEALHVKDVPWASRQMWAPDAACKNGLYYLYFPAKDKEGVFRIGVAVSENPAGPFRPEPGYIPGSFSIDPAVFTDGDGRSYMYFGGIWGGQLERWQSGVYDPAAPHQQGSLGDAPAITPMVAEMSDDMLGFKSSPRQADILDEHGRPLTCADEDRRYFEGPWMHKHNGKYYLSYSTGTTHYLVYAEGDSPLGPFTYKGRILEPVLGWTSHHSIVEFEGKWYLFYHDSELSGGVSHKRCVKHMELDIAPDGTIATQTP